MKMVDEKDLEEKELNEKGKVVVNSTNNRTSNHRK